MVRGIRQMSASGTSPTMCWSAGRSAICRTSQRRPTSASVLSRRTLVVAACCGEGLFAIPLRSRPPGDVFGISGSSGTHSASLRSLG